MGQWEARHQVTRVSRCRDWEHRFFFSPATPHWRDMWESPWSFPPAPGTTYSTHPFPLPFVPLKIAPLSSSPLGGWLPLSSPRPLSSSKKPSHSATLLVGLLGRTTSTPFLLCFFWDKDKLSLLLPSGGISNMLCFLALSRSPAHYPADSPVACSFEVVSTARLLSFAASFHP